MLRYLLFEEAILISSSLQVRTDPESFAKQLCCAIASLRIPRRAQENTLYTPLPMSATNRTSTRETKRNPKGVSADPQQQRNQLSKEHEGRPRRERRPCAPWDASTVSPAAEKVRLHVNTYRYHGAVYEIDEASKSRGWLKD